MAVKVKQDMIDFIKAQGMDKALKRAGSLQAKGTKGEAEFIEGVRRMYGANRLSAATAKAKPAVTKPTDSRFSGVKKPNPTKPTDSRFTGVKKTAPKPTDSRFTGMGAGKPKSTSRAGSMSYTPGSAKNNKATYTTGSGVSYKTSTPKKAAPAQKTKDLKKNPLVKFVTSRVGGKSGGYGNSK